MTAIILAIIIGFSFGFVLDRVGATNPGYIIKMLNLSDLHLMKTILGAIGVASVLLFGGLLAGVIDPGHLSVKTAYTGVFAGGILLGLGFAVAGYCPGTGLTAAATGRIDAFVFVLGGLLGAAAYMVSFSSILSTGLLDKVAGGKATLGHLSNTQYPAMFSNLSGEWMGLLLGILFIFIAAVLPRRLFVAQ